MLIRQLCVSLQYQNNLKNELQSYMNYMTKGMAWLCMGLAFTACSNNENEGPNANPETRALTQEEFVETGNDFGFKLLRDVAAVNNGNGFVLSPLSVTYALGMLNEGARGETRQEIMKVLGFEGVPASTINELCRDIMKKAPLLDESVELNLANGVFLNEPLKLQEGYRQTLSQYYNAEAHVLNFGEQASLDYINKWCSQKTQGMIPEVLDKLSGICYLINAIYFKADWTYSFDPELTQEGPFFKTASQHVEVPFMHSELQTGYTETTEAQVIRMPFGNEAFGMYVLLPKDGKSPTDVLATLSTAKMAELNAAMQQRNVEVVLPRFTTRTHTELSTILEKMGMQRPFSAAAQLEGIIEDMKNGCLYVSRIFQDAAIEVQEKGAKAAAATVVEIDYEMEPLNESDKVTFIANRPFVYLITEKSTGNIYFAGVYAGE